MADIYDGAFRTIINDCSSLIIPLINEIFDEDYRGDEQVEFKPNEHFIDQLDAADAKRITDTNFTIEGKEKIKSYHLECESSLPDGKITIRLFEYDAQIALDQGDVTKETLTVTFPHTAVLYLRSYKTTPDKLEYVIVTPGGTVRYDVPVMKTQAYGLDEIFSKKLLLLLPFYIFSHEKDFKEYNDNSERLEELKAEYREILRRLDVLEQRGGIRAFDKRTITEISADVIRELAKKYENVKQEVGDIMGGALLETEARKFRDEGLAEGLAVGLKRGRMEGLAVLVRSLSEVLSFPEKIWEVVVRNPEYEDVTLEQVNELLNRQK